MFHRLSLIVVAFVVLFAAFVRADFPTCAQPCLGQASAGSCSYTDNNCMCQHAGYCNATNLCFRNSCSYADWKVAYDFAVYLCNQAGVTSKNVINPPTKRARAIEPERTFTPVYARRT